MDMKLQNVKWLIITEIVLVWSFFFYYSALFYFFLFLGALAPAIVPECYLCTLF